MREFINIVEGLFSRQTIPTHRGRDFLSASQCGIVEDMVSLPSYGSPNEDDLFEMANLVQTQTGITGVIYISTSQGSHAARVKYFEKTGKGQPSFSMSIGPNPQIVANSLPDKIVSMMEPLVAGWVRMNHSALQNFWNNGTEWTDPQVTAFKRSLKKFAFNEAADFSPFSPTTQSDRHYEYFA